MSPALLIAALLLAGAPSVGRAGSPSPAGRPAGSDPTLGKEIRTIPLSEGQARRVHIVRTAPSYPCTIEFPEAFAAAPACGDCGDKAGLFRLDVFSDQHYLVIKPRVFAGPQPDGSVIPPVDFVTTVTVRLKSFTLTIQVEYTEDNSKADPRVVFTLPDRSNETTYVRNELARARKQLEEEFALKLDRGVTSGLLHALTETHSCVPLTQRTRKEDLVLEAKELCAFGPRYFIRFTIENRNRSSVELADVSVRHGASRSALAAADDAQQYLSTDHLEFQAVATGVVGFRLDDGQPPPRLLELTVQERGGQGRVVNLSSIEP